MPKTDSDHKHSKRLVKGAVALTTAAALLTGGLFHSPADFLQEDRDTAPQAIVQVMEPLDEDDDGSDDDYGAEEEEKGRRGFRARLKQLLLRLPLYLRLALLLPLWCIGWVLITGGSALFQAFLSPALGSVLRWLCITALVCAGILGAVKLMFPDVPLKKLLTRKSFFAVLLSSGLLGLGGTLLQIFYPDLNWLPAAVDSGAVLLLLLWLSLKAGFVRRRAR